MNSTGANKQLGGGVVVQQPATGPLAMIQTVFSNGDLIAFHANLRIRARHSGGAAVKESTDLTELCVAFDKPVTPIPDGRVGVRTHQLLIAVLGAAQQGRHRRGILAELANGISRRGPTATAPRS